MSDDYRGIAILAGITLGFPILILILMFSVNPNVSWKMLGEMLGSLIVGLFIVGAVFEIKRLVDKDNDGDAHHH